MTTFFFTINLKNYNYKSFNGINGPLFTKWLPDGEKNAISLNLDKISGKVFLWFERFGFENDDGYIEFNREKKEVNPILMKRQGVLEAGPLFGKVILDSEIPISIRGKIENKVINENDVINYIKPIVKEINVQSSKLVNVLKYQYGQYWLEDIMNWDSKIHSLSIYCEHYLKLQLHNSETNELFLVSPNEKKQELHIKSPIQLSFPEYLTIED